MKLFFTVIGIVIGALMFFSCSTGNMITQKRLFPIFVWAEEGEVPPEARLPFREYKPPWHRHPCGVVRKIEISKIPPYGAADFIKGTERVVEFDQNGKTIGSWAMPVNSWVMATDGNSIIVHYNFDKKAMSISGKGAITLVEPVNPELKPIKCPGNVEGALGNSAYERCLEIPDTTTGKTRRLVYETPCT